MKNVNKIKISPDEIYGVGQDKKSWFPAWNVLDDKSLYEKVNKLAHSTFDRSKFTVVGSPNITDDGIASGFSSKNYISFTSSNLPTVTTNDKWSIKYKFTLPQTVNESQVVVQFPYGIYAYIQVNPSNIIVQPIGGAWYHLIQNENFELGATYEIEHIFNGTNCITNVKKDGTKILTWTDILPSTPISLNLIYISLGIRSKGGGVFDYIFTGSIDLKQFSVTVDGVEVFSGNKTGIDTIKPDDYTSTGSPVISNDGILSYTTANEASANYIVSPSITLGTTFDIFVRYKYTTYTSAFRLFGEIATNSILRVYGGTYSLNLSITASDNSVIDLGSLLITNGKALEWYTLHVRYDGTQYTATLYDDEGNNRGSLTPVQSALLPKYPIFNTQTGSTNSSYQFDLNSIKIYVDGNLVYQPCLKIPYTEAKGNKKVVDKPYRDRVKDLFKQEGYNGYHTIDEDNENFTLPTHNFDDVIDCYEGESGSWEQTVGQVVKQQGLAAETGVEVTLMKPYKDEDSYALSIPYTSKTASSFVPAADGDWFAKGKVVL